MTNKKTTIADYTTERYSGMAIYAVEPVHTDVGVVCCVASNYQLHRGDVVEIVFTNISQSNHAIPVTQDINYKWVKKELSK